MLLENIGKPIGIKCDFDAKGKILPEVALVYNNFCSGEYHKYIPLVYDKQKSKVKLNTLYAVLEMKEQPSITIKVNIESSIYESKKKETNLPYPFNFETEIPFHSLIANPYIKLNAFDRQILEHEYNQLFD